MLAGLTIFGLIAAIVGAIAGAGGGGRSGPGAGQGDPLAFASDRAGPLQARAAAGYAHVLYALSPGGAPATARRVAALRPLVEAAGRASGTAPDRLEAIIFLESAGRPDVVASPGTAAAAGLAQILPGTARQLLGLHVDEAASHRLGLTLSRARARRDATRVAAVEATRRRVDQRFDPVAALGAAGRYLALARRTFGRDDLATESYHMGIGNLQGILRAYGAGNVSYVQLFFDSSPMRHPAAWQRLASLGDDSDTYLWRVLAAQAIMARYRHDPAGLDATAALQVRKNSAEEVLHPLGSTKVFGDARALRAAYDAERLVPLPDDPRSSGFAVDRGMGQLAGRVGGQPSLYRGLRPEALALLGYLARGVRELGGPAPLDVTSSVRDEPYQRALAVGDPEATHAYSMHTTGFAFDVSRRYASPAQAHAFQFWLDRLQALDLVAWIREPAAIHVAVAGDASRLLSGAGVGYPTAGP